MMEKQQQIKEYLESITEKHSARIILIKDDLSHIYAIQEALNKNAFVCMHADRFLEGNKTISGNLLNKAASFPAGPFLLGAQFQVARFIRVCHERPALDYHFYASAPKIYTGDKNSILDEMLRDYCRAMEKMIRRYPLQWYNYYDFWA